MKRATGVGGRWLGFAAFWLALTGGGAVGLSSTASVAVTATTVVQRAAAAARPVPARAGDHAALGMVPRFLWHSLVAGVDVARRAFAPRLPLATGYVVYPVSLPGSGRAQRVRGAHQPAGRARCRGRGTRTAPSSTTAST